MNSRARSLRWSRPTQVRIALVAALAACSLFVLMDGRASAAPPACSPGVTHTPTLSFEERSEKAELVATHPVTIEASFPHFVLPVTFTAPTDVRVYGKSNSAVTLAVPSTDVLPLTMTWIQHNDPNADGGLDEDNLDEQCSGTAILSLPVKAANKTRGVKGQGFQQGYASLVAMPALKDPDLAPLEISARVVSKTKFPAPSVKESTMVVPMRSEDKVKYPTKLPSLFHLSLKRECKLYLLTCGTIFTEVARLESDPAWVKKGILRGDPNGPAIELARTQPAREAAAIGLRVDAAAGATRNGKLRKFGYDISISQSGRLIARVRKSGQCSEKSGSQGIHLVCTKLKTKSEFH